MDTRFRVIVIMLMGLLASAVWMLPTWWPLLNPDSVAAGLPGMSLDERADYATLPQSVRDAYFLLYHGDEEEEIEGKPDWTLSLVRSRLYGTDQLAQEGDRPFEVPAGALVDARGTFSAISPLQQAQGTLTIYRLPDDTRLLRIEEDFLSTRAPNIHIILTRNPDPMDERGVGIDYIDLGALRGNVGGQTYLVPQSVDFDRYPVLALYAPQYDALLAVVALGS